MIQNNPYLALEGVWRDTKKRNGDDGIAPVPSPSPRSMSPSCDDSPAHKLNLSAICISNILMLEDRHIPSIFIRMYEYCLQRNDESPDDDENNARLRLLNYLFQRWHETRNRLTFYRDVFKVISVVAKPIIGEHMSIAVEMCPINQHHVVRELLRNLRRETRGRTLGEFLEQYGNKPGNYTFHDMGLELFTRDDVREYDSTDGNTNVVHSFIGDLFRHPFSVYFNRLLLSITRSFCHLRLNMSVNVSNKLFNTSVPSWAEEDTETGMINMDNETRERLRQSRENITRLLTKRKIKMIEQRKHQVADDATNEAPVISHKDGDKNIPKNDDNDNNNSNNDDDDDDKIPVISRKDDDYHTIDTESFLGDNATLYSESLPPLPPPPPPLPQPVAKPTITAVTVIHKENEISTVNDEDNDAIRETERNLKSLLSKKLKRQVSENDTVRGKRVKYDLPTGEKTDDEEVDSIVIPPTNTVVDNTITALRNVDDDIMKLSQHKSSDVSQHKSPGVLQHKSVSQHKFPDEGIPEPVDEIEMNFDDLL